MAELALPRVYDDNDDDPDHNDEGRTPLIEGRKRRSSSVDEAPRFGSRKRSVEAMDLQRDIS